MDESRSRLSELRGPKPKRKCPWRDCSGQGRRLLQQVSHAVGKALLAEHDREATSRSNLLQNLQLTHTHERRVLDQQLGRVGLAADRGRFLTPRDQVGLSGLLGLRDLVHQVLHLARQDYVPNTDRSDLQTQLTSTLANGLLDLLADRVLANQEGVEFTCANDGPQSQLRLAIQRLTNVVRRANCLASIDNAVRNVGVDTQRYLVSRHDLLTADISR